MSTRSRIGMLVGKNEVRSIYCHHDGYCSYNGVILLDHWDTQDKIEALLNLGDISCLGHEIGEDQGTGWFDKRYEALCGNPPSWDNARNDPRYYWCLAYGRDRGGENTDSVVHDIKNWPDCGAEYEYLWKNGQWYWRNTYDKKNKRFTKLTHNSER